MSTRTLTPEENLTLAELRLIARVYADAWKKYATTGKHGGGHATPEQQARIRVQVGQEFTNEMRSRLEVLEFIADPPEKYFAYIKAEPYHVGAVPKGERLLDVTTWTGETLGRITWQGSEFRDNFGGKRVPFRFEAINGHTYSGTYYKSSGSYCRVKRVKQ